MLAGGLEALQSMVIVAALPFALLLAAAVVSLHRVLAEARAAHDREDRELLRAEKRWLERERGQQEAGGSASDVHRGRTD